MGTKRILVDATHQEQTRVALIDGNQIEDFEVEVTSKKPLKGNIYLARISRIEPSLQAAFVEYGGNRHGFLPFSEIHPDYFLIPDNERKEIDAFYDSKRKRSHFDELETTPTTDTDDDDLDELEDEDLDLDADKTSKNNSNNDFLPPHRRYNIQDVLKRRQILLIQVVKEERGNKGAALTTYLSVAGRYCVLMPNTNHTGGVSRRIASVSDRRRLRDILKTLQMPEDMAVIVRTAGSQKSRLDIQRDYEYLLRVWSSIRAKALNSYVPTLLYEEADLIKRTIRDMYSREINEILIAGPKGFETAKEFMSLLIPSRINKLRQYQDKRVPLFERWGTEKQLEQLLSPEAALPSGGYLVINPTEALIAIDVNSGKSTKENSVEDTAVATNIEAATEVARQLRLRNLAGLVVIDFIDMEVSRHKTMVERRLREALSIDRSRVQVGHISPFGLLELSRQRTSPSLLEAVTSPCTHCGGNGIKWSVEAAGLQVIRGIEAELMKSLSTMLVYANEASALWILNEKREWINQIENEHDIRISIISDSNLSSTEFRIDRIKVAQIAEENDDTPILHESISTAEITVEIEDTAPNAPSDNANKRKRRRRRRPNRNNQNDNNQNDTVQNQTARNIPIEDKSAHNRDKNNRDNRQTHTAPVVSEPVADKSQITKRVAEPSEEKTENNPANISEKKDDKPIVKTRKKPARNTRRSDKSKQNTEEKVVAANNEKQVDIAPVTQTPNIVLDEKVVEKSNRPKKSGWWNK